MSHWTHLLCEECWGFLYPQREPVRAKGAKPMACCSCGKDTDSGIYFRQDPALLACCGAGGIHG